MFTLIRLLLVPLASLALMMVGSGLFNTFVPVRLEIAGFQPETIGIVVASLYAGVLLGSFKIDRWISKVGHIRSFIVLALILSTVVLIQGLWLDPWYWAALRFIGGICSAGVFIIVESWCLMQSPPNMRSGSLSIYLATLYGALSAGQLLLDASDPFGFMPYCITALFLLASVLPMAMRRQAAPKIQITPARCHPLQLLRLSPLGTIGGVISGMVLAVIYGFVPVFAKEIGMSLSEIGLFMAILIFGGFSLQWPIGRWADLTNRHNVLNIVSFATAALGISIGFVGHTWLLYTLGFCFGGCAFTLYPLSMAYACEKVKDEEIVAATGSFVLSYGLGAVLGPILAPIAMYYLGTIGIFYFLGFIAFVLGLMGLKRPSPAF